MTSEQRILLHLTLVPDVGLTVAHVVVDVCRQKHITLPELYQCRTTDFVALGFTYKSAHALVHGLADHTRLETELTLIENIGARVVCQHDLEYPDFLAQIGMPPLILYVRGFCDRSCSHNLAIVGSRRGTAYGRAFIDDAVPVLAAGSWTIISGGARGIDAMAHEAALACSAKTVVVLGSGLLCPYPHEHKNLFDRIVQQGGCVLSPFYMTAQPEPWRFPVRNRIIAGMSRGVLIVQAAQKSGAHSTASCALEYGREVFAVPGLFHDELSAGCHRLIKQGAVLVSSAQDILQELEPQYVQRTLDVPKSQVKFQDLNLREKIIYVCRDGACVDDLVQKLGVPMEQIYHELFTLQLDGVITQDFAGLFHAAAF